MTYEASASPAGASLRGHEISQVIYSTATSLSGPSLPGISLPGTSLPAAASRILDEVRGALPHDLAAASVSATRLALLLRESVTVQPARPAVSKGGLASWQERKVRA